MTTESKPQTNLWSSRLTFIIATTGAAVGVGNIWKFPYMAGQNGGAAFVLIYILSVVIIGIPVMLAELFIGYRGRHNPVDTMKILAKEAKVTTHWQALGWWGLATLLLVLSFYSVISGWSIAYFIRSVSGQIAGQSASEIRNYWHGFLNSPLQMILWHTVFMIITMWIVERGVRRGLELSTEWMMPLLFLALIGLDIYGLSTKGFNEAWNFLFSVKTELITPRVIIDAMGHAFFTLAVGAGALLVYGAYVPRGDSICGPVMTVAGLDILVALLSGLAIFPIVFTYGLHPAGGPGLLFEVLPIAFAQMPWGGLIGAVFFLLFMFAALTSSINLAEPLVILLAERYTGSRKKASLIVGLIAWIVGIGSCLSFNRWENYKLFGQWNFFGVVTDLATNIMLPIGGLGFAIFAGWIMHKDTTQKDLQLSSFWFNIWHFLIRYVATAGILIIFIHSMVN